MELKLKSKYADRAFGILLIVPYGIETINELITHKGMSTFNCTLWNWNNSYNKYISLLFILLIVPYGIETVESHHRGCSTSGF